MPSTFFIAVLGSVAGTLSLILGIALIMKTKKLTVLRWEVEDLKENLFNQSKRISFLEKQLAETKTLIVQRNLGAQKSVFLKVKTTDSTLMRTGKEIAQRAYEHPETAVTILATSLKLLNRLLRR